MTPPAAGNLVRRIVQRRVDAFDRELPGTLTSRDIEHLHRLRVACRRLRVVLESFRECWPAATYKSSKKQLRRIGRTLGPSRDLDTQIAFLKSFLSSERATPSRPSLGRLIRRLSQERARFQPVIAKTLTKTQDSGLTAGILRDLREVSSKKTKKRLARRALQDLKKVRSLSGWADRKEDVPRLHRLRIAVKHLRYTLEDLSFFYPGKLWAFVSASRQIQRHLGNMHNSYTWRKNSKADAPDALDRELKMLQDRAYGRFFNAWKRQKDQKLWKKLRCALK